MKIYIATPINARKEPTIEQKLAAARERVELIKKNLAASRQFDGCEMISTFDLPHGDCHDEAGAMGRCIAAVLESDAVFFDDGWVASNGCQLEHAAAFLYGKYIYNV